MHACDLFTDNLQPIFSSSLTICFRKNITIDRIWGFDLKYYLPHAQSRKFQTNELVEILRRSTNNEFKSQYVDLIAHMKTSLQFDGRDKEFNKNTRNEYNFSRFTSNYYKRWQKSSRKLDRFFEDNDECLKNETTFFY